MLLTTPSSTRESSAPFFSPGDAGRWPIYTRAIAKPGKAAR
jgi:hypothetical protein